MAFPTALSFILDIFSRNDRGELRFELDPIEHREASDVDADGRSKFPKRRKEFWPLRTMIVPLMKPMMGFNRLVKEASARRSDASQ